MLGRFVASKTQWSVSLQDSGHLGFESWHRQLCALGQITLPVWASVYPSVRSVGIWKFCLSDARPRIPVLAAATCRRQWAGDLWALESHQRPPCGDRGHSGVSIGAPIPFPLWLLPLHHSPRKPCESSASPAMPLHLQGPAQAPAPSLAQLIVSTVTVKRTAFISLLPHALHVLSTSLSPEQQKSREVGTITALRWGN